MVSQNTNKRIIRETRSNIDEKEHMPNMRIVVRSLHFKCRLVRENMAVFLHQGKVK